MFSAARLLATAFAMAPVAASALSLDLPAPVTSVAEDRAGLSSYGVPVGPYAATGLPLRQAEGQVQRRAFRLDAPGQTTLQLMVPLRDQLARDGYRVIYECAAFDCGGFDFRFGAEVMPEPDMHVDLGDFRYLAAESRDGGAVVSLLVSRSAQAGFVHLVHVDPAPAPGLVASSKSPQMAVPAGQLAAAGGARPVALSVPVAAGDAAATIGARLTAGEAVVLDGLAFASGAGELSPGDYPALQALARWLQDNTDTGTITLTGHTDSSGAKDANLRLSRARAAAVKAALVALGVPAGRITAAGLGPDQPLAPNDTAEGRTRNRRVEVTLTPTPVAP